MDHTLALPIGTQLDYFRIETILGKGTFGITYVARDIQLGKRVAIKELLPDSIATRSPNWTVVPHSATQSDNWQWARERFLEEARILASFSHPAIVGIHRIIDAHGTIYLVMDFIEGETYDNRLRRIGREPNEASLMAIIGPLLEGLREVHAKGLLHRDIKPENILINQRGQPVLIDFGAARASLGATMTMTSIVTHGYSPFEQYQTKCRMGPWTDVYAVGALMCRAMTGEKPPVATDRILQDDFTLLANQNLPGFSEPFRKAVDWSLRVRTEERPQRIDDWTHHLSGNASSSQPPEPVPETVVTQAPATGRNPIAVPVKKAKKRVLVYVLMTVTVVAILGAVLVAHEKDLKRKSDEEVRQRAQAQEQARIAQKEEEKRLVKQREEEARYASLRATKEAPFENTLGMKFAPVSGTNVLFSVWETRVRDYDAFARETGRNVFKPDFSQTPNDPVVYVSWDDAKAFCAWLTQKERGQGKIARQQSYRLPTDAEWSTAVGLHYESGSTPKEMDGKIADVYPWGTQWPPPRGAGNYDAWLEVDSFDKTSPAGSFSTNRYGLYDMGGNVWEWCENWYDGKQKYRVLRGGSCSNVGREYLLSSYRYLVGPDYRCVDEGFRCVLSGEGTP